MKQAEVVLPHLESLRKNQVPVDREVFDLEMTEYSGVSQLEEYLQGISKGHDLGYSSRSVLLQPHFAVRLFFTYEN